MKMVKKLLSASVIAALALTLGMSAHAEEADADAITIDSVVFSAVEGDDTLVKATVGFTAVYPAEEVTILMATQDAITTENTDDVMYINQVDRPEDGVLEFVIEKSRILASTEADDVNNTTMYVKMGGTDIDTMASSTGVIELAPDYVAGDATEDGIVSVDDANAISRHLAGWSAYATQTPGMDCTGDDVVSVDDANAISRHLAGWSAYAELQK